MVEGENKIANRWRRRLDKGERSKKGIYSGRKRGVVFWEQRWRVLMGFVVDVVFCVVLLMI
jgi:hypothetical protein